MSKSSEEFRRQNRTVIKLENGLFSVGDRVYKWDELSKQEQEAYIRDNENQANQVNNIPSNPKAPTQQELEDFWYDR